MRPRSTPVPDPATPQVVTRTVRGFTLRESRYAPGYGGGTHRHGFAYLGYVVRGDFEETSPRGRTRWADGSLHLHPADDPHAGRVGAAGARCFSILPDAALSARLDAEGDRFASERCPPFVAALAARLHRGFLARDAAWDLECEGAALELVAAVVRFRTPAEAAAPRWLHVVRDHLHDHAGEAVPLARLAAVAGVHPVHLVRTFRRVLGVTPAEYARRIRLEVACRALAETDRPIVEVALEAGYANQAHLTRVFRERLGATPAVWRRARRARLS